MAIFSNMNDKSKDDGQVNPFQYLDPHKLCSLESDISVIRNEVHEHKHLIKVLDEVIFFVLKFGKLFYSKNYYFKRISNQN